MPHGASSTVATVSRPLRAGREHGALSPRLALVAVAAVVFIVAFLAIRGGGSSTSQVQSSAGDPPSPLVSSGECGVGTPDATYTVSVTSDPDPPRPDGTTFHLAVRHDGQPLIGAKVCFGADMPDMQHPGVSRVAKERAGGVYDADLKFSMGGSWVASVTVLEPGKGAATVTVPLQISQ
jgi:hypothetical protein